MVPPLSSTSREIILGVGGGIAAYKSCDLLRRLQDAGFLVSVIPTRSSLNFVGKATWEALSGRRVQDDLWNNVHEVPHISMAKNARGIVIAPATADLIARIASGRADDFLTNVVLASSAPVIVVPAMHTEMWLNPATVANVQTLRNRGVTVIDPAVGKLTSGDVGAGRYPESSEIVKTVERVLEHTSDLVNRKVLISAGGTREPIDAVRFIGNASSGKQGIALAIEAAQRGADVTLVIANTPDIELEGINVVHVSTAREMQSALEAKFATSEIVVMAAAVSDARPVHPSDQKIAKSDYATIELITNPDIIAELCTKKEKQFVIGFAAQTGEQAVAQGQIKLKAKNLDLIYINDVSGGAIFGSNETSGTIIDASGNFTQFSQGSKSTLASQLLSIAIDKLGYAND